MNQITSYIRQSLQDVYSAGELNCLTRIICCDIFGQDAIDFYLRKDKVLSEKEQGELESIIARLKKNEPIQYIQGVTPFLGMTFRVAPGVLIPRPETAELVQQVVAEAGSRPRILDIGTGSGCIAISLAKLLPEATVTAWDISEDALVIARQNSRELGAVVSFESKDVFSVCPSEEGRYDLIVSNPPYITEREKQAMEPNVLEWEPGLALFVPDEDPLRFYRCIATLGLELLTSRGKLFFEINRAYGTETADMLRDLGYLSVRVIQDISANDRIVIADR